MPALQATGARLDCSATKRAPSSLVPYVWGDISGNVFEEARFGHSLGNW